MKIGILWHPNAFALNSPYFDGQQINTFTGHNTGNMAYVEGLRNIFDSTCYQFLPWGIKHSEIPSDIETLIFPAANQLGPHTELANLAKIFENYQRPIVAIGLGAQFKNKEDEIVLSDGTRRWLDVLINLAPVKGVPNILTRGDFTASILDRLGYNSSYVSAGCPSQFINLESSLFSKINEEVSKSDFFSSTYNASHYSWKWAKEFDREAFQNIRLNAGGIIVQAPGEYLELIRSKHFKKLNSKLSLVRSFYDDDIDDITFIRFIKKYFFTFSSAASWREWLAHFDFNYGTRIHGTMLALQTGIPSFLVTHDTRTEELAIKMGLLHVNYKEIPSSQRFVAFVKKQIRNYNFEYTESKRRENSKIFLDFLNLNNLSPSAQFINYSENFSINKSVDKQLKLPISNNILSIIENRDQKIFEVYDFLSALPSSIRLSYKYTGFKCSDIHSLIKSNILENTSADIFVFSASFDHASDFKKILTNLNWKIRKIIFRADKKIIEDIENIISKNFENNEHTQFNQMASLISSALKEGFVLRNNSGNLFSSVPDSSGKIAFALCRE